MIAAIQLGLRLAVRSSNEARVRSGMVALAAAVGTAVIMSVLAIAAADRSVNPERYADGGMSRVVALIVVVIAVQVAGLAGVAGRLAAAMRGRRLGNLRLLGLSAGRARLVAAVEVGVSAAAGAAIAATAFPIVRILLSRFDVASQSWSTEALSLSPLAWVGAPAAVVCIVVAVTVLPERLGMRAALGQARQSDARIPSPLRLAPLLVGVGLCLYVQIERRGDETAGTVMLAAIALTAVGTVLVLPIFVRLASALLLRNAHHGTTLIAGRRLQAQPAAMTRVVTGLLLGLFVVVGARNVVAAWEATPQYVNFDRQLHDEQRFGAELPAGDAGEAATRIRAFPGVREVAVYYRLEEDCTSGDRFCGDTAIVADCATFEAIVPTANGCRDGQVMQIGARPPDSQQDRTWRPLTPTGPAPGRAITTPAPSGVIEIGDAMSVPGGLLIPPSYPSIATATDVAMAQVEVVGDPGRNLPEQLNEAGLVSGTYQNWSREDYDFVVMLRTIVYTVAAIVVGVGLFSFAIAAIDRAMSRRRELVSLRLLGVPAVNLRRSQWIESLVPVSIGTAVAVILGQLAGATYLAFGDQPDVPTTVPWAPTATIAGFATLGGVIVAALTVIATNQTIKPETIRSE